MDLIDCSDMRLIHMILTLSNSHEWGVQQQNKIGSGPWSQGEGSKLLNFNNTDKFNLCVFLQIKHIKHIEWDVCSDALAMPQRWDLGAQGLIILNMSCVSLSEKTACTTAWPAPPAHLDHMTGDG